MRPGVYRWRVSKFHQLIYLLTAAHKKSVFSEPRWLLAESPHRAAYLGRSRQKQIIPPYFSLDKLSVRRKRVPGPIPSLLISRRSLFQIHLHRRIKDLTAPQAAVSRHPINGLLSGPRSAAFVFLRRWESFFFFSCKRSAKKIKKKRCPVDFLSVCRRRRAL